MILNEDYLVNLKYYFYSTGSDAKRLFENFRKQYQKKKNKLRDCSRSGTSTAMVEKAHREYDDYKLFHWYDDFQRPRNSITNSHKHKQGKLSQSLTGVQAKALESLNESIDEDEQGDNDSLYEESESETTKDGSDANKNENAKDEIPVQRQPKKRQANDPTDEILVDLAKK